MLEQIDIGMVVRSKRGRDNGKLYLVYEILDDGKAALLVNGRDRSLKRPKKKNPCHLQVFSTRSQLFSDNKSQRLTDELIRLELNGFGSDL